MIYFQKIETKVVLIQSSRKESYLLKRRILIINRLLCQKSYQKLIVSFCPIFISTNFDAIFWKNSFRYVFLFVYLLQFKKTKCFCFNYTKLHNYRKGVSIKFERSYFAFSFSPVFSKNSISEISS